MNSPTCSQCDCIKGCSAKPSLCPILVAECIASGQVSAAQIEAHRVLDAAIAQPTIKESLTVQAIAQPEQPAPVRQPLTDYEILTIAKSDGVKLALRRNPNIDLEFARAIEAKITGAAHD